MRTKTKQTGPAFEADALARLCGGEPLARRALEGGGWAVVDPRGRKRQFWPDPNGAGWVEREVNDELDA